MAAKCVLKLEFYTDNETFDTVGSMYLSPEWCSGCSVQREKSLGRRVWTR